MDEKYKQRLLTALTESDKTNSGVEALTQSFLDSSRLQLDLNAKIRAVVLNVDDSALPSSAWEELTDGITAQSVSAEITRRQITELQFLTLSTNAITSTVSVTAREFKAGDTANYCMPPAIIELQKAVQSVFDGRDSVGELVELVQRLRVDNVHPGTRTPTDHLQQAALTLRRPPGATTSPTAVFMDFREGVDTLLENLLRRTRRQQRFKDVGQKIAFIGEHVGYLVLGKAHFQRLGHSFVPLRGDFTDAKAALMSR
jgi:hypothetical protein